MSDVLLLGIGNLLLADDGLGPWFAATFPARRRIPPRLEVVDGGTLGLELLDRIAGRRALIVVDAVSHGGRAGDLVRLEGAAVPAALEQCLSTHDVALSDLLAAATLLDCAPQTVILHGVVPATLAPGTEFSPPVRAALAALETLVVDELARFDCLCPPRAPSRRASRQATTGVRGEAFTAGRRGHR